MSNINLWWILNTIQKLGTVFLFINLLLQVSSAHQGCIYLIKYFKMIKSESSNIQKYYNS